ncbi:PAAR-like protein [Flavobacterium sp. H122]|uniref:PAAR-like protein n=1 Tax=Flavobacterium sp. H122 TaxID=2529860 RepID=UPI0010A9C18B|nr:PAAR-like protein [Flavobacterium sp. H122]
MSNPILYTIKKGDTLSSIAKDKGINRWKDLQVYHNQNCPVEEQIYINIREGKTLYTPPKDKIDEMNGTSKGSAQSQPEKKEEKKEDKKEEKKEESKSEHDGKYYVVHGAKCVCDMSEVKGQKAELQVTSHQKMINNDQSGKFAATEDDKQLNPPSATFGKCTLKPSSSGNQPCALAPAPKWEKPYDKTTVMGKKVLTEISHLKCTVGGIITIEEHGQTDSVTTAHAQNTDPVQMAHANPGVNKPIPKADYPVVNHITIENIENRKNFTPVKSGETNTVGKFYVRPNENCSFTANIAKGNKNLASWVVYDGFEAGKDKKLLTKEQIGTSFSNSFPALGNYRIEGYGKPKTKEFEKGKFDKNYPSCSIDITVAVNKLDDKTLLPHGGDDFTAKIGSVVNLRKDFPATFTAKFLMHPTKEELARLEMYVTDEAGNRLTDFKQEGRFLTFTPTNSDAVYNFYAVYQDAEGNSWTQTFKGKTLAKNYVVSISHTDQVVREFTGINFEVKQMRISSQILADGDLTTAEIQSIKWNLNNVYQGNGRVLSIQEGLPVGSYIVEAYCISSNAIGTKAAKQDDDWRFEVKRNDVVEIQSDPILKIGKKAVFTAGGFIFKDLLPSEKVNWTYNAQSLPNTKSIEVTPSIVGNVTVTAKINTEKGITKKFEVVQPVLQKVMFTDNNGIGIEKSAWGNKINIWLKEEYLIGEKLKVSLQDKGTTVHYFPEKIYDGGLIPLELNDALRKYTKDYAELKVVVSSDNLTFTNEKVALGLLKVNFAREVYSGLIGTEDARYRHDKVDYDMISWFYGKSRGIKESEKVTIEIWEDNLLIDEKLLSGEVSPDKSGCIKFKIDWGKISKGKQTKWKNVYVKVFDNVNQKALLYDGSSFLTRNLVPLIQNSKVTNITGYSSAAIVGSTNLSIASKPSSCQCKFNDLIWSSKVSCEFLRKVEDISKRQNIDPNIFMAAMAHETGGTFDPTCGTFDSHRDESKEAYVGLIQIGKDAAKDISTTRTKLLKMSQIEQLDYVEKYLQLPWLKGKLNTLVDFYLAVIFPYDCGKGNEPNHIVFDNSLPITYQANGKPIQNINYWRNVGYAANKPFLKEGKNENGKTYVWEIEENIKEWYDRGKLNKKRILKCDYDFLYKGVKKENNWHDPVDNPMLCLYTQNGNYRPRYNVFGTVRKERSNHNHQGIDLLAIPGSNVYACVDAEIEFVSIQDGYGKVICLKVKDTKAFLERKKDYKLIYESEGELLQGDGFDFNGDIFLFYAHLQSTYIRAIDKEVKCGDIIGTNGTTGYGTTKDPHLHFEIRNKSAAPGLTHRCHPGYFINFKNETEQSVEEKKYQENIANYGWD